MGKLKQNAKASAQTIRENKWISICVIVLALAAVAVTVYLLFRPAEEATPKSPAISAVLFTSAPDPSSPANDPASSAATAGPAPTEAPGAPVPATPAPAITPPAESGSPVSGSNIVLNPVPPPVEIDIQ